MKMFGLMMMAVCLTGLVGFGGAEEAPVAASPEAMSAPVAQKLTVEAKLGTGIESYNVVGEADSFDVSAEKVVGWTRITGAAEPTEVTHIWSYNGKEISAIPLSVKAQSFRTWSRKTVTGMPGAWTFQVKDAAGEILVTKEFTVTDQGASAAPQTTPPAPAAQGQ